MENNELMKALIGLSEPEAENFLRKEIRTFRVVERDGEGQMGTMDYDETRVRLQLKDNKVVGITFG